MKHSLTAPKTCPSGGRASSRAAAYAMPALLAILVTFNSAIAQDAAPINPAIGEWNLTMTLGGDEHPSNLIISEVDGELKGIWSSRLGSLDLDNITYEGDTLTFKHSLEVAGETLNFHFEGKIDDGDITGHFLSGGDRAPVTGTKVQQAEVVGIWEVTTEEAGRAKTYTLTITPNMLGTYTGEDKEYAVTNVEQLDDRVTFDIAVTPNQPDADRADATDEDASENEPTKDERTKEALEGYDDANQREFEGTLTNDMLHGDIYVGGRKVDELIAKRKGSAAAQGVFADYAGTWELSVDSQIGDFENQMVINPGGSGMYISDQESELRDLRVDDGWLTFITTVHVQGAQYEVEFEGQINPEGILLGDFYLDGSAVARIEGNRADDD